MGVTWAWLAGFTDGDGYIKIITTPGHRHFGMVRIIWSQKRSEVHVLDSISNFLVEQGHMATSHKTSVATAGHKYPQSQLQVSRQQDVRAVLAELQPLLVLKADEARRGIETIDMADELRKVHGRYWRKKNTGGWHAGGPRDMRRQEAWA